MKPNASLRPVSIVLAALLLAPVPAWAHSEGSAHGHADQSKAAAQKPSESATGMFRWTDDGGRVHYAQGLDSVPQQFRSTAVPLGQASSSPTQPRKP